MLFYEQKCKSKNGNFREVNLSETLYTWHKETSKVISIMYFNL